MKSKPPTTSKTTRQRPARRTKPGSPTPSVSAHLHERIAQEPASTMNDGSVKGLLMTGFRRSRRSSDNRTHGMLTGPIVVDPPVRSKTDKPSPRRPLTRSRGKSWRGKPTTAIPSNAPLGTCALSRTPPIKGMRFPIDVMLVCLRGYAACPFRYRPLEEMLEERGPSVVHCGMSVVMVMWATERLAITIEA